MYLWAMVSFLLGCESTHLSNSIHENAVRSSTDIEAYSL
jgi:hypothetical protein